jgi:hypothetical protein
MYQSNALSGPWPAPRTLSALGLVLAAYGFADSALAGFPVGYTSRIDTTITDNPNGTSIYDYTVVNTTQTYGGASVAVIGVGPRRGDGPLIVDWELPYAPSGQIDPNSIMAPAGWDHAIETIGTPDPSQGWGGMAAWQTPGDPFYVFLTNALTTPNPDLPAPLAQAFLDATQVIHWYIEPDFFVATGCTGPVQDNNDNPNCSWGWTEDSGGFFPGLVDAILPNFDSLDGFGFAAPTSAPVAAPYQASWFELPVRTGDPPVPGQPSFTFPTSGITSAPEPGPLALLLAGLAGLVWRRRS